MDEASIVSEEIAEIARIAVNAGNMVKVISGDWKPRQVVFMDKPLAPATKALIVRSFPRVELFSSAATPHNPATEGFIDRVSDVAIEFPALGEARRWY